MKYLILALLLSFSFSECDDLNLLQCSSNSDCEWIEDINNYSCSGFSQNQCYQYEECDWTLSYGGSYGSWSHTCSGSYQIDDSYCQENPNPPTCDEMTEFQCVSGQGCDWVEDIEIANCYNLSWSEQECLSNGCSYNCTSYYGCWCSGEYEINNSFCEENNYMQGDLNGDMTLNILDIIIVVGIILNNESNDLADINNDGLVNIIDIVQLVNIIMD